MKKVTLIDHEDNPDRLFDRIASVFENRHFSVDRYELIHELKHEVNQSLYRLTGLEEATKNKSEASLVLRLFSPSANWGGSEAKHPICRLLDIFGGASGATIIWRLKNLSDIRAIYELVFLSLEAPFPCSLHIVLPNGEFSDSELEQSFSLLQAGSPVEAITFHYDARQRTGAPQVRFHIRRLTNEIYSSDDELIDTFNQGSGETPSAERLVSVKKTTAPKIVLHVSALWGWVGSSAIFNSQTNYLIDRGFFVVRIFVDHYPRQGPSRNARIERLVSEDVGHFWPHLYFVAERIEDNHEVTGLPEFVSASPLLRTVLLLSNAAFGASDSAVRILCDHAQFAIVNHLYHFSLTKSLTKAPILLETHDIFAEMLDIHGIPLFVPIGQDGKELRLSEEQALWSQADACVNLSRSESALISTFNHNSHFILPHIEERALSRRSWLQVVKKNSFPESLIEINDFDIMLFGSQHGGNVAGINWFIEEVLVDPRLNDAKVVIVGPVSFGLAPLIEQDDRILVTGFVDNLDDFFARSKVIVIPDVKGTGISMKLLGALAVGACFSTTAVGGGEIDFEGTCYHPSSTATELADDIVALLNCEVKRSGRSALARELYKKNISFSRYRSGWDAVISKLQPHLIEGDVAEPPESSSVASRTATAGAFESPILTAVICTHNRYSVLPDAIDSLLRQRLPSGELEIVVVDNSTDQEKAEGLSKRYRSHHVRYILEPLPGLSNARNVGLQSARSSLVAYIDDDAIAEIDWAKNIISAFQHDISRIGVVGGRVKPLWIVDRPLWLSDRLESYLSILNLGDALSDVHPGQYLVGCNIAYNKELLLSIGGFSTSLGRVGSGASLMSNEEIKVGEEIQKRGMRSIYQPKAIVQHVIDPARLSPAWFRRRAAWQAVSDLMLSPEKAEILRAQAQRHLLAAAQDDRRKKPLDFFSDDKSAEDLEEDIGLIYDLTIMNLSGGAV